jgi:hypothetical protein
MKSKFCKKKGGLFFWSLVLWGHLFFCPSFLAQSSEPKYPTPITSNEINGTIKARDVGDPRLTTHFYVFNGNQGDIFINVLTKNFDGDIDIFTADTLRPLTKIVVYSDTSDRETGRVIYLRQPQKLILRIEGRTPNDEPATYRIKFAGSFQPLTGISETEEPELPEVKTDEKNSVRVNTVGTIIEVKPKPAPKLPENIELTEQKKREKDELTGREEKEEKKAKEEKRAEVIVTENISGPETQPKPEKSEPANKTVSKNRNPKTKSVKPKAVEKKEEKAPEQNPLDNIRLVVLFKDGSKIERPISEITRFTIDKGILTIVHKNGSIGRYSILEVAKITVE